MKGPCTALFLVVYLPAVKIFFTGRLDTRYVSEGGADVEDSRY